MMGIVVTEHCVIVNIFGETVGPLIYDRNSCNGTLCYSEYLGETVGPLINAGIVVTEHCVIVNIFDETVDPL